MQFRVALDLDGVSAETMAGFCNLYNKRNGTNLTLDKIKDGYFFKELGFSTESFISFLDEVWSSWWEIPPTDPKLTVYLEELAGLESILFDVVTCRSKETIPFARKWLEKHKIPYHSLINTENSSEKLSLEYDVYIDDNPGLMKKIASNKKQIIGIFYVRPWNSDLDSLRNVFPAKNWSQISKILRKQISIFLSSGSNNMKSNE